MLFFLLVDILLDSGCCTVADTSNKITHAPEIWLPVIRFQRICVFRTHPPGRCRFVGVNKLCQVHVWFSVKQDMDVIRHAFHGLYREIPFLKIIHGVLF